MGLVFKLIQIVVFTVNIILWAAGIVLLVLGAIAVGNPDAMINALNNIPGVYNVSGLIDIYPLFEGVAIFMIVLGSVVFLFGFVGCHGAFRMHKRSMCSYWILLLASVGGEIALIIYAALFPDTMTTYIQTSLETSLTAYFQPVSIVGGNIVYANSGTNASSWEHLQAEAQCCGALGPEDFFTNQNWLKVANGSILPPTCCASTVGAGNYPSTVGQFDNLINCQENISDYWTQGCYNNVQHMVYEFDLIAIITSACLMAAQLIALVFTIHTWHKLVREDGGF